TFYDPDSGVFGALGHGINDVDTAMLMPLESGSIMPASVSEVKKGASGAPGELHGQFDLTRDLGTLYANTNLGIFGQMPQETVGSAVEPVEVASREQVETGPATILTNIQGDEVEEFQVEITHLYPEGDGTRSMMIQVTDPALLETTGGIVQGMSGSPILQNGRLVGAVTHVLVNDPTRGYGILAENMLRQATGES
ncbi:MAG: SpoIVB peptidase, partial [Lawsonibacter sp.]|nr:SpoIVB peptidase [Lawsonibacter sp.]